MTTKLAISSAEIINLVKKTGLKHIAIIMDETDAGKAKKSSFHSRT